MKTQKGALDKWVIKKDNLQITLFFAALGILYRETTFDQPNPITHTKPH